VKPSRWHGLYSKNRLFKADFCNFLTAFKTASELSIQIVCYPSSSVAALLRNGTFLQHLGRRLKTESFDFSTNQSNCCQERVQYTENPNEEESVPLGPLPSLPSFQGHSGMCA
jgi:hypothetical protein